MSKPKGIFGRIEEETEQVMVFEYSEARWIAFRLDKPLGRAILKLLGKVLSQPRGRWYD